MMGFFTPSEAGAVGTFAVLMLAIGKSGMRFKGYVKSLTEALRTAGMLLMLIAGSTILGHFIAVTNIPQQTADWVVQLPISPYVILIVICIVYLIGGSFIDDLAFMILATHLLPGSPQARLQSHLVRDIDRRCRHDRCGDTSCSHLRLCSEKHNQSPYGADIQGRDSVPDLSRSGMGPSFLFSRARPLASFSVL
jgi:hypothetical protein